MTRYNDFRMNSITIIQKTMVFWDNAHYTQNDNHALYVGAFWKNKMDILEPWIFEGKLIIHERKQRLNMYQSTLLKSEIIRFLRVCLSSQWFTIEVFNIFYANYINGGSHDFYFTYTPPPPNKHNPWLAASVGALQYIQPTGGSVSFIIFYKPIRTGHSPTNLCLINLTKLNFVIE